MSKANLVKVSVLTSKSMKDDLLDSMYDFGVIHLKYSESVEKPDYPKHFEEFNSQILKVRFLKKKYNLTDSEKPFTNVKEALEESKKIDFESFESMEKSKKELETDLNSLTKELIEFEKFKNLNYGFKDLNNSLIKTFYSVKPFSSKNALIKPLSQGFLVSFPVNQIEKNEFLTELPESDNYSKHYKELQESLKETKIELEFFEKKLADFEKKVISILPKISPIIEEEFRKQSEIKSFGLNGCLVYVEGFIQEEKFKHFEKKLEDKLGNNNFKLLEIAEKDENKIPTLLENPLVLRPFQAMVEFSSTPSKGDIDPTVFFFIFFSLFFGMILGDVGYGLVILIGALFFVNNKNIVVKVLSRLLVFTSISTIIFGFIFAEFFGGANILGLIQMHALIDRVEATGINTLIELSILFGFIQLSVGYLVGAYNNFHHKHTKHGIAKIAWFLTLLFGYSLLATSGLFFFAFGPLGFLGSINLYLLIASVVLLIITEGFLGAIELPGLLSNFLSYLRLTGLGLSGAFLAKMVHDIPLTLTFSVGGVLSFLGFLILILIGHSAAIVLGIFESGIQSLRLQYVEFFSKFYKGGGIKFKPFRSLD
ncbi:V-type ATPase 116kDa subunit family protein [uncultured archaeon]|nr:V-type ATPase 116kDa subunit family protein [uncultured archaeon]